MGRQLDLVVNPAAGAGRSGRMLGDMSRELARAGFSVEVHRTTGRASLHETVRRLVGEGAETVAVMGGDGTFHDAANALLRQDGTVMPVEKTHFALIPAGTGSDLAGRTLALKGDVAALADRLARAEPRAFDLGRLEYTTPDGGRAVTLFTNIASCGISGRVDKLVAEGPKWLTGKASYMAASTRAMLGWQHQPVTVRVDGAVLYDGPMMTVAVCNGRSFGGGMIIAPMADASDGQLEVVVLGDFNLVETARNFPKIYDATHIGSPKVLHARGREVVIETHDTGVLLDVDGETPGRVPGTFTVLPGALTLRW